MLLFKYERYKYNIVFKIYVETKHEGENIITITVYKLKAEKRKSNRNYNLFIEEKLNIKTLNIVNNFRNKKMKLFRLLADKQADEFLLKNVERTMFKINRFPFF